MLARFEGARPSTDIDLVRLTGDHDPEVMAADYNAALMREHGDYLRFEPDGDWERLGSGGARVRHTVYLGDRELMRLSADLNPPRGIELWHEPDVIHFPDQLLTTGADGETPDIRVISLQDTLAHKLSGMYTYGFRTADTKCEECIFKGDGLFACRAAGSELPYRPQDLADTLLMAMHASWDGPTTHAMLHDEFAWRISQGETLRVPDHFEVPNPRWYQQFSTYTEATRGLPYSGLGDATPLARAFLDPLLAHDAPSGTWDPQLKQWVGQPGDDAAPLQAEGQLGGHVPAPELPAGVRQLEGTGHAPDSTALADPAMVDKWNALAAGPEHARSLDAMVTQLKESTDADLSRKLNFLRNELLPRFGESPTDVTSLDSKNLRFYVHQSGELYGHSLALMLDHGTTLEIAYQPDNAYELYRSEAYHSHSAYLGTIPDDMTPEQANVVAYMRAQKGLPAAGLDPDTMARDLIDLQAKPLRDALALRQRLIDEYGIEPGRIRLVHDEQQAHYASTRWMRAQLRALDALRDDPEQARQTIVDMMRGLDDGTRALRDARVRAVTDRLYEANEGHTDGSAEPGGDNKYALLWVRNSAGQAKGHFIYGTPRDTRPEFVRQTIEMLRTDDPGRRVALVGDDLFTRRPGLLAEWEREGVLDGVDTETLVKFWEPARNGGRALGQAEQALIFHQLMEERDTIQVGMFSGALENAAVMGMPTVYFEPSEHDQNRGSRLLLYSHPWVYGKTDPILDERGNPAFDDLGRAQTVFRAAGEPLSAPLRTIDRVLFGPGRGDTTDPHMPSHDFGRVVQTVDRLNRIVDGGDLDRWPDRLGRSLAWGSPEWDSWDHADWARSHYYADQLHRWLNTDADTPEAAGRKWDAIRLALKGVIEPDFRDDPGNDNVGVLHPYATYHTSHALPDGVADQIDRAYTAAPDDRGRSVADTLKDLLTAPDLRDQAQHDVSLFRLTDPEVHSLRDAIHRVVAARDQETAAGLDVPSDPDHAASHTQIIVIAKEPVAGRSKTRLTPPFTFGDGADIARASLTDTLEAVSATPFARSVLALEGQAGEWLPDGVDVIPQRGAGLDERLAHAFDDSYADMPVPTMLIGMDTPQVTPELLRSAADALRDTDAVLGPANDGGYWLLGLRVPDPSLIVGVPMSQDYTGAAQLERLRDAGLSVTILPPLTDIDTVKEAMSVAAGTPQGRFAAAVHGKVGPSNDPLSTLRGSHGFTWSPSTGSGPAEGFMIALPGHTVQYPEEVVDDPVVFAQKFREYLLENRSLFEGRSDLYLGGWVADGKLWLEPSRNILDEAEAVQLARESDQIAIYNVATGQYVDTGGTGGGG